MIVTRGVGRYVTVQDLITAVLAQRDGGNLDQLAGASGNAGHLATLTDEERVGRLRA